MTTSVRLAAAIVVAAVVLAVLTSSAAQQSKAKGDAAAGSHATFDAEGIAQVDGKPFFPIGVFLYELNAEVLAELRELRANTVVHGFKVDQLDLLHRHGLMAICESDPSSVAAAERHPATLAWYLTDEPENRGVTAEAERKRYLDLKKRDPRHPVTLCHTSFEALTTFKDACDVTMTDIYPITKNRDQNVLGVGIMMDEARRIHGAGWPQWTYLQTFGGPETDNGVWAVPLPHEVRFMAYQALVHRATGLLYFSYWPRAARTWQSVAVLNGEIQRLVPRLVAPGREGGAKADAASVQVRARRSNDSGVVIAINTAPRFVRAEVELSAAPAELALPFEGRSVRPTANGRWAERFPPYGVHVYVWGPEPDERLAGE